MAEKDFKVKHGLFVTDSASINNLTVRGDASVSGSITVTGNFVGGYAGFDSDFGQKTTDNLSEGSNLYYTTQRIKDDFQHLDSNADVEFNSVNINGTTVYGDSYGSIAVNVSQFKGDSTQTVFNIVSSDSSRDAVLALGIKNQSNHAVGLTSDNDLVVGISGTSTSFKIKNNVGDTPFNLTGGTDLFVLDDAGKLNISNASEAIAKTNAAVTITGGLGVDKNIRGQDIIAAGNVTATGSLFGTLSAASLSARSTTDLSEGGNLYYTDARVDSYVNASILTSDVSEGTNLYYTTARADSDAKNAVSVNDGGGDGSLTYNSSTGVITYTGPSASEVRAHISGGTGVTFSSGEISIGQTVANTDSVEFAGMTVTGNLTVGGSYILNEQNDLRVTNALIKVADSNASDAVDIGVVGRYSTDGGSTIRRAGFFRDATNGEWYTFTNLIQNSLDSSPAAQTIDISDPSFQLGDWNFGTLKGTYVGFDSDFAAFSSNYVVYESDFTAVNAGRYALDTTDGIITVTLPASPSTGDYVRLIDVANFVNNSVIVDRNGSTIEGFSDNFELDLGQSIIEFIYINNNWQLYSSIGQRGPKGDKGDSADAADFSTRAQSIAFAVALG